MLFEIADLASIWIEVEVYERDLALVHEGQEISATVEAYPNRVFRGRVSLIYPELNAATRTNRVRFEIVNNELHLRSGMYATVVLDTPVQQTEPFKSRLVSKSTIPADRVAAIASQVNCPVTGAKLGSMGDPVSVQASGQTVFLCCAGCEKAIGQDPEKYLTRMRTVSDAGVLSVPESAVIDTGNQKIVYIEREEGLYDGVEVQLGPKSDGYYAVVAGLMPGDRVAAAGAFLIDAETRLNPAASASYFGASGGPSASTGTTSTSDGMAAMPDMKKDDAPSTAINFATSRLTADELVEIGKLSIEDQKLAKEQVLCPVTMEPLGSMGKPLKVMVKGDAIMICCKGCAKKVEKEADAMLEMVRRWREKNREPARDASQ
jgi:Cu(I)/Ag(I) efflux system membrane fusion protein